MPQEQEDSDGRGQLHVRSSTRVVRLRNWAGIILGVKGIKILLGGAEAAGCGGEQSHDVDPAQRGHRCKARQHPLLAIPAGEVPPLLSLPPSIKLFSSQQLENSPK